ncbi:hypothetical protein SEB_p102495 (plasmid) [Staphylococcus epidermidis PM221]|nr:hypothetical protein SEB_p102495 [Staphylococcus epidermidis PM221]
MRKSDDHFSFYYLFFVLAHSHPLSKMNTFNKYIHDYKEQ